MNGSDAGIAPGKRVRGGGRRMGSGRVIPTGSCGQSPPVRLRERTQERGQGANICLCPKPGGTAKQCNPQCLRPCKISRGGGFFSYYFQIRLCYLLAPFPRCRPLIPLSVALRFIRVSQREKFAAHLSAFSSGNSIASNHQSSIMEGKNHGQGKETGICHPHHPPRRGFLPVVHRRYPQDGIVRLRARSRLHDRAPLRLRDLGAHSGGNGQALQGNGSSKCVFPDADSGIAAAQGGGACGRLRAGSGVGDAGWHGKTAGASGSAPDLRNHLLHDVRQVGADVA